MSARIVVRPTTLCVALVVRGRRMDGGDVLVVGGGTNSHIYLCSPTFTNGIFLGAFVLNAVIKSWNRHRLVKMLVARSRRPANPQ